MFAFVPLMFPQPSLLVVSMPKVGDRHPQKVSFYPKSVFGFPLTTPLNFLFIHVFPEYWDNYGETLPTIDELLHVWDLDEMPALDNDEEGKAEYQQKVNRLMWYLNSYVPNVCGIDWCGPQIRPYHLMTDKTEVDGEQKVFVTTTSEACGLLQFENNREKWIQNFKYKKQHGSKATPPTHNKKKKETLPYKSKWSDTNQGQGSGWDTAAYGVFKDRIQHVKNFRKQDEKNGYAKMNRAKELLKKYMKIEDEEKKPAKKKSKKSHNDDASDAGSSDATIIELEFEDE